MGKQPKKLERMAAGLVESLSCVLSYEELKQYAQICLEHPPGSTPRIIAITVAGYIRQNTVANVEHTSVFASLDSALPPLPSHFTETRLMDHFEALIHGCALAVGKMIEEGDKLKLALAQTSSKQAKVREIFLCVDML